MRTVAIVGSHPKTRAEFDFTRTDCDIWVFNEAVKHGTSSGFAPRADAVFQMHEETIWKNPGNRNDAGHFDWLKSGDTPLIYMQQKYPEVPRANEYPLAAVCETLLGKMRAGKDPLRYFSNSVDYALALAAYLRYEKVEMYGVEMETNTEYQYQRPGVAFWVGYLGGMGVEVEAHCAIFDFPLYGYEGEVVLPDDTFDKRIAEIEPLMGDMTGAYQALMHEARKLAREMLNRDATKELLPMVQALIQKGTEIGRVDGAMQENRRYAEKAAKMREKTEKFIFSRQEFESSAKRLQTEAEQMGHAFSILSGQLQMTHDTLISAAKGSPKREKILDAYLQLIDRYVKTANMGAVLSGASQENMRYMGILDKGIKAAGGAKAEAVILERMQDVHV